MHGGPGQAMSTLGRHRRRAKTSRWIWTAALAALLLGCQQESTNLDGSISAYRDRILTQRQGQSPAGDAAPVTTPLHLVAQPVPEQAQLPPRASLMAQPTTTSQPAPEDILAEIPDPTEAPFVLEHRAELLRIDSLERDLDKVKFDQQQGKDGRLGDLRAVLEELLKVRQQRIDLLHLLWMEELRGDQSRRQELRETLAELATRLEALESKRSAEWGGPEFAPSDQHVVRNFDRVAQRANEYLKMVSYRVAGGTRPQVRLSLAECVQRAIENNYTIRIEAHNPAISATQIVQAEAAFDVEFFLDTTWADLDPALVPGSVTGQTDTRSIQGGFRKLLATGASASVAVGEQRQWSAAPQLGLVKTWNPVWPSDFTVTLAQPLMRNFGLDVNRAQITISRIAYQISMDTFVGRVRDTLLSVEQAYWALAQARRRATIFAESTAQNLITYENMKERLDHDATQVEVSNSESQWKTSYVAYLEFVKIIRDAEDQLKNLLNDPTFKLSDNVEIIPTDTFFVAPIALDQFAEVRTALDRRSEILAARKQIDQTRVNTMVAKNGILPRLDLSFQYQVQGLGNTSDNSFDNLTTNRYVSYTLGASFSYNFGERAARAAWRRARLQESQAVVSLNQVTDGVVQEVNNDIRTLMVRYMQIPPSLESVQAAERNLRALQARTQRIDPSFLQTELSAVVQLSNTRSTLLDVLVGYNVGIVELEKAKGTLLDYNNIVVSDAQSKR